VYPTALTMPMTIANHPATPDRAAPWSTATPTATSDPPARYLKAPQSRRTSDRS
jgi:hypothetical protein